MSNKNRGNRQQFRGQINTTAAQFDDAPKDKFEDDEVDFSNVSSTPATFAPTGNEHPVTATRDLKVARVENYTAYNAAGEAIGQIGESGPVGPSGVISDEEIEQAIELQHDRDPEEPQDEREGEDHPSLNQDHDDEVDPTEESVEDEAYNTQGEDFGDLSGDGSLTRAEFESRLGAPLNEVAERQEEADDVIPEEPVVEYPFTPIESWTAEELEHYISRPDNMDIYHSKLVQAIGIHRQLFTDLHEAWSVDDCTAYFKDGVKPPKTSTGAYVNDVTRRLRREGSWTTQELEAWALGEIKAEGLVTTNGLAVALHERFSMPINSVEPELVIAHYKHNFGPNKGQVKLIGEIPAAKAVQPTVAEVKVIEQKIKYAGLSEMSQTYIEETLKRYCDAVRPNRVVPPKKGEEAQRELHNAVLSILKEQDPAGVKSGLDILFTKIVEERIHNPRGVFSDTNAFRFAEGIPTTGRAQEIHRRLFTLFFAFIDGDEGILAQTDVPELIKYLPSNQQNLILGYLGRN